jgi:hypothetical protein
MRTFPFLLAGVALVVVSAAPAPAADTALMANGRIVFATVDGMASMVPTANAPIGWIALPELAEYTPRN